MTVLLVFVCTYLYKIKTNCLFVCFSSDIDECKDKNTCSPNADCLNSHGSYECRCKHGFNGNGKICTGIHERFSSWGWLFKISANSGLDFNPLFWFMYFCSTVCFKTSKYKSDVITGLIIIVIYFSRC